MPPDLRALLQSERNGVLATLSASRGGWPFASVAPFALSPYGEPLLLLSRLAEHTRNLHADPRASILVQDSASRDNPQAGARVTILGTVELVPEAEREAAQHAYIVQHPRAAEHLVLGDFRLYVLRVDQARYISGFGDMGWIDADRMRADFTRR